MWMMYGYFCGNIFPVVVSFGFGAIAYISVYYTNSLKTASTCSKPSAVPFQYSQPSHSIILYGAPFEKAWFVLRTKNAAPIQLPMVICGATNNALWVIYTPLDGNWFMFIPNAICVVLGISLLTLYVVYRPGKAVQPAVGLPDEDNAITIVVAPKADKIASASPSVQPMPSPLLPLSRENSFQLSSPSMSRGSSFQQLSSPALSTRGGSSSFDRNITAGVLHVIRAPRQ
ncbi:hypothetical protein PC120_g13887 [Phytophthora cactorum]|nr:hypothetical protein PC120_g13887 [Phytophthora cactorum]